MSSSSKTLVTATNVDGERTMEMILRELREKFAKQAQHTRGHSQQMPLPEEIERAIKE